jgi:ubiquinone biosynthesis UbiH/UbiF/VisC/COQ6 family hydroxylase
MLGIHQRSKAYGHSAIIANISLDQSHNKVAYERFTDQGPMALLPLPDFNNRHRCSLVWTQPSEQAETFMAADESVFLEALQARFGHRLGAFKQVGEKVSYPLALTTSEEQVRRRLVVVGNAAHSLHPVAGQGFNLSLRDINCLAQCLADQPQKADAGELEPLLSYQSQRDNDQRNTLMFTDNLSKVFGLSSPAIALSRNTGLLMMDLVPTLRQQFAHFGMGTGQSGVDYG